MKLEFSRQIFKNTQISNFMKVPPVGAELFHADRQTDMMKLLVAFRNIAKRLNINIVTLLKWAPNFTLPKQQCNEIQVGGRILLGDNTGTGEVMLRPIMFQCAGVQISTWGHPCTHTHIHIQYIYIYISIYYGLDGPGIESRWGARISAPVQTGPGAHPASCTMGTGSFPGVKYGRGVRLTTHPLLVPWSWKSRAIPLPTLWATRGL
jgi:hypothetical protein